MQNKRWPTLTSTFLSHSNTIRRLVEISTSPLRRIQRWSAQIYLNPYTPLSRTKGAIRFRYIYTPSPNPKKTKRWPPEMSTNPPQNKFIRGLHIVSTSKGGQQICLLRYIVTCRDAGDQTRYPRRKNTVFRSVSTSRQYGHRSLFKY